MTWAVQVLSFGDKKRKRSVHIIPLLFTQFHCFSTIHTLVILLLLYISLISSNLLLLSCTCLTFLFDLRKTHVYIYIVLSKLISVCLCCFLGSVSKLFGGRRSRNGISWVRGCHCRTKEATQVDQLILCFLGLVYKNSASFGLIMLLKKSTLLYI